jgi:pilus assembly protein CpaB
MSLEVSEKTSVNQLIRPNDHVDILGTFRQSDGAKNEEQSVMLLQNVIVLATGRHTGMEPREAEEDRKYTHVAVLVTAKESELLTLAQEAGTLNLTLRNATDPEMLGAGETSVTTRELFNTEVIEAAATRIRIQRPVEYLYPKGTSYGPASPSPVHVRP